MLSPRFVAQHLRCDFVLHPLLVGAVETARAQGVIIPLAAEQLKRGVADMRCLL